MAKRTNRVAWGLVVVLTVVVLVGGWLLFSVGIPAYLGRSVGPYSVGVLVAGRWQVGPAPVNMSRGRIIKLGFMDVYVGTPLTS